MTASSATIAWSTDIPGIGIVECSRDTRLLAIAPEPSATTSHAVTIAGLPSDGIYSYRVWTSGEILAEGKTFRTARTASTSRLRFAAFADSGSGSADQLAVAALVRGADPDFVLIAGDVVYEKGEAENFDPRYFVPYADLIDHIPFYTALGNHDVLTLNGEPYIEALHLPHNNPESTERYYSFEDAGALFIALDSNQSAAEGSPMRAWLTGELARPSLWKIVFYHHPIYSSGPHGGDADLRADLEPLFTAAGVDLVLNGHDHDYERTFPILDGSPVNTDQTTGYVDPAGVIYVVTGGGGKSLYEKQTENAFTVIFRSLYHMVLGEIDGRTLSIEAIEAGTGAVFDSFTLTK